MIGGREDGVNGLALIGLSVVIDGGVESGVILGVEGLSSWEGCEG